MSESAPLSDFTEGDPVGRVREAAQSGDRASLLRAMRDKLASELDSVVMGRDAAVIARELRAVVAELEQVKPGEDSALDDLAARRAARLQDATGS